MATWEYPYMQPHMVISLFAAESSPRRYTHIGLGWVGLTLGGWAAGPRQCAWVGLPLPLFPLGQSGLSAAAIRRLRTRVIWWCCHLSPGDGRLHLILTVPYFSFDKKFYNCVRSSNIKIYECFILNIHVYWLSYSLLNNT